MIVVVLHRLGAPASRRHADAQLPAGRRRSQAKARIVFGDRCVSHEWVKSFGWPERDQCGSLFASCPGLRGEPKHRNPGESELNN